MKEWYFIDDIEQCEHSVKVREDFQTAIVLPADLRKSEAERLARQIETFWFVEY